MTHQKSKPVAVIFAPTACGKTALVQNIFGESSLSVLKGRGEVVSADSQAVYRGFNIGTAKPSPQEQKNLIHHLIDIADPLVQFGAGDFIPLADQACNEILLKNKIPVVTGGTGFYLRNFILGLPKTPESDPAVRNMLKERIKKEGSASLYAELKSVDPQYAQKINENDSTRICRALEVYAVTGKTLSSYFVPSVARKDFDFCVIVLQRDRKDLYERIDRRVDLMFEHGLVQEVEQLKKMGYDADTPAMKAIGYSEFFQEGLNLSEIKEKIKLDSHHYAKKQYTYMKGLPGAQFVDADDEKAVEKIILDFCRPLMEW